MEGGVSCENPSEVLTGSLQVQLFFSLTGNSDAVEDLVLAATSQSDVEAALYARSVPGWFSQALIQEVVDEGKLALGAVQIAR
jgi:hypothetical protein